MKRLIKITVMIGSLLLILDEQTGEARWLFPSPEELLAKAVETGDITLVRKALSKGAHVNARIEYWGDDTWTVLMIAAKYAHTSGKYVDIARLLVKHGACVNVANRYGMTPLMRSIGNVEMVKLLLDHHANVHASDDEGFTALGYAARSGKHGSAMVLIQHGADITRKTRDGQTLLIIAAGGGNTALVTYLIEQGLDVNATTRGGYTALMNAVRHTSWEVMELLLEHGADPNARMKDTTALGIAVQLGDPDAARILLKYGANVQGKTGQSVLESILSGDHCLPEFIELLQEYGVDTTGARCEE